MRGFKVFEAGILLKMELHDWLEIPGIVELISVSTTTTTADGHLIFWEELTEIPAEDKVYIAISSACCGEADLLNDAMVLHIFFKGKEHLGSYFRLEKFSYATEKRAEILGNSEDQQPGYTIYTIFSNKRTLRFLTDKWMSFASRSGDGAKSGFYVSKSSTAVQARFFCDEVRIEDVIDFYIVAGLAIKEQRNSRMIYGQSYDEAITSPEKDDSYKGNLFLPDYCNQKIEMVKISVEEKYGPFEKYI
jgi:hypothetical protein